ncbi:hypothetical protein [Rossellomorea marisflavi]|uniref:hypothetical protein n=1 Tax=Rossellomorea marisflavi TaxID=189381 RepID=UPI003FA0CD0A
MITSKFRIDLGQGDSVDVTVQNQKEYTLNDILKDIKESKEWFVFGDTAIQKTYIKRVVSIK